MTLNRFDQSARFVARLDPVGFFNWLLTGFAMHLRFLRWSDTRTTPPPGEEDLTGDTIAELEAIANPAAPWLMPVEFQTEPDPDMFGRLLCEMGRLWQERRPDELPGSRYQLASAVVNLLGTPTSQPATREYGLPGPDRVGLCLWVRERYAAVESAEVTLKGVASGKMARCILALVPLMQGGGEDDIIRLWMELAGQEPDPRRRATLGYLALTMAELKNWHLAWKKALEGWDMRESMLATEIRNAGKSEGALEALKRTLKTVVQGHFKSLPNEVAKRIDATDDLAILDQAVRRVFEVSRPEEIFP